MKILFLDLVFIADSTKIDTTKKSPAPKALVNIATGGMPKEFFLGTVLFMILIFILILFMRIKNSDKAKGI
jgi:hypothetical protein